MAAKYYPANWKWMVFFMPGCARIPDFSWRFAMLMAMVLGACSNANEINQFEIIHVDRQWSNGWLRLTLDQRLTMSNEARNALEHGVPLTVATEISLRNTLQQTRVMGETNAYEIRYLALSNHFQLSMPDQSVKTFPRLRHVLAELSRASFLFKTGALPAGSYELRVRTHLDRTTLPPPMRLPVLLSGEWRHDSNWTSWPVQVDSGT
jgi:hypothetical protein